MKKTKKVVDEVFEKCKKAAAMITEDEKHIIFPSDKEVSEAEDLYAGQVECPDCEKWTMKEDIKKCPDCGMKICPTCMGLHKTEHLAERYEEEEEEVERTNNPQWR